MRNLTIARKLQLMIINAIVALCIVALTGFYGINSVSRVLKNNQTNILPSQLTLGDAKTLFVEYRLGVMQHIQNGSIAKAPELDKYIAETSKKLGEQLDFYAKILLATMLIKNSMPRKNNSCRHIRQGRIKHWKNRAPISRMPRPKS